MSKAAKDVVHDTLNIEMVDNYNCLSCGHHQPESLVSKALRVVAALTKAGWLREEPRVGPCGEGAIKRLTRERDEARQLIAEYRKVAERYEANTASPEVMRVVEAAEAFLRRYPTTAGFYGYKTDQHHALGKAVDALSASRQPKAQEPRYEVVASSGGWQEGGCVRSIKTQELVFGSWRGICDSDSLASFHKERCIAECARLNGEGGGK